MSTDSVDAGESMTLTGILLLLLASHFTLESVVLWLVKLLCHLDIGRPMLTHRPIIKTPDRVYVYSVYSVYVC